MSGCRANGLVSQLHPLGNIFTPLNCAPTPLIHR